MTYNIGTYLLCDPKNIDFDIFAYIALFKSFIRKFKVNVSGAIIILSTNLNGLDQTIFF